ncbi:hypothetical protein GCM10027062_30850 [Nocardioides hungaricus]
MTIQATEQFEATAAIGVRPDAIVSSTDLHEKTKDALERVRVGQCVAITRYNAVDAVLVPPARMRAMNARIAAADQREREFETTVPLILAAARSGVAIPSETLDRVAPGLDASWQAIAEFAAAFPLRLTHGEHGEAITRGELVAEAGPVDETGDYDELNFDA